MGQSAMVGLCLLLCSSLVFLQIPFLHCIRTFRNEHHPSLKEKIQGQNLQVNDPIYKRILDTILQNEIQILPKKRQPMDMDIILNMVAQIIQEKNKEKIEEQSRRGETRPKIRFVKNVR